MAQYNISFAGAGRVASALCKELFSAGFNIETVISENEEHGRPLAEYCNANWSSDPVFLASTTIIIVAVPDHKLKPVLDSLKCHPDTIVVHTAGSFGLDIFPEQIKHKGVFYPLQTFSKNRKVSFNGLPVLLESSDDKTSEILRNMGEAISADLHIVDSEHRMMLHLAAVFVSNFTNHMFTEGKDIASKAGFTFGIFEPLIKETVLKAIDAGPENSQTGPAIRNDENTIKKHLEMLSFSPDLQKIYNDMTQSIIEYYKDKSKKERERGRMGEEEIGH